MLKIRQQYVAGALIRAAEAQYAADTAEKMHARALTHSSRAYTDAAKVRETTAWHIYWACKMEVEANVESLRRLGALLMFGCAPAVAAAAEVEYRSDLAYLCRGTKPKVGGAVQLSENHGHGQPSESQQVRAQ